MIIIVIYTKIKKSVIFKNPYKNKNLYIVYIMSSKKIAKLNQYFYMTPEEEILTDRYLRPMGLK